MDPFSIAVALTALLAGSHFKNQAMKKVSARQGQLASAERMRQTALEDEKQAAVAGTLAKMARPAQEGEQQSIAEQLSKVLAPTELSSPEGQYSDTNAAAPEEIRERQQAVLDESARKGRDYAARLGNVSAYNLLNFNSGTTMNRLGEKTGEVNTQQMRSANILPAELQGATSAGNRDLLRSDIANGIGTIFALGGFGGGGTEAAAAPAGGSGITAPAGVWDRMVPRAPGGLNPARSGTGLRLTF